MAPPGEGTAGKLQSLGRELGHEIVISAPIYWAEQYSGFVAIALDLRQLAQRAHQLTDELIAHYETGAKLPFYFVFLVGGLSKHGEESHAAVLDGRAVYLNVGSPAELFSEAIREALSTP